MNAPEAIPGPADEGLYAASCRHLGGRRWAARRPASRADVHAAAVDGVPYGALLHLLRRFTTLTEDDLAPVLGLSTRTLHRHAATPSRPMPPELASKAWLLAETLARAEPVFGGQREAERWLAAPAAGLDGHRPLDLLRTWQGAELVTDFLVRLEHGVYS